MNMDFDSEADYEIYSWIMEQGTDVLQSAYLKLQLGMATPEEQMVMATFIQKMRNLLLISNQHIRRYITEDDAE